MSNKFIRFLDLHEITPAGLDGHKYRLGFEVGERRGDEFHSLQSREMEVQVSGTLQAVWGKSNDEMALHTGATAASYVLGLAKQNNLDTLKPLVLNTYTAQKEPLELPPFVPGVVIPVNEATNVTQPTTLSFLSEDISELRDQINALAKDLWGDRLLLLSQERPLFDMYRSARNADEFRLRIQSLGIIAKDLNRELLRKRAGVAPDDRIGDFVLLGQAIQTLADAASPEPICEPLKQLNNLRQGYPTHGDNAKKFLQAHRYFGLPYPISEFSDGWESVLAKYFESMRALRDALSAEWKRLGEK